VSGFGCLNLMALFRVGWMGWDGTGYGLWVYGIRARMIDLYQLGVCSYWQIGYPLVHGVLHCYYALLTTVY